jgi:SWI/SNF-related matrix-associated actin-dependent regulator of chromatin subfamily A3
MNAEQENPNCESDDPSEGLEALFRFQAKIVGKRFYKEKLNDGELVYLIREPNNPYDRNAIKVESINHQQVGHISAGSSYPNIAACLAPILDCTLDPSRPRTAGALAEAVSVEGAGSKFSSLCVITLVGLPTYHKVISQHLQRHCVPHKDLKANCCVLGYVDIKSGIERKPSTVITEHQTMSAKEIIDSMNAIWDEQDKEIENLALSDADTSILEKCMKSKLLNHQKVGVAWMLKRESAASQGELPPFYKCLPDGKFAHALTLHHYSHRPKNVAGGILADSMGLGKSLQLLSLILAHPPPGRSFQPPMAAVTAARGIPVKITPDRDITVTSQKQELVRKTKLELKALCLQLNLPQSGSKDALINRIIDPNQVPLTEKPDFPVTPTLIVCPLSVISTWQEQLASHIYAGTVKMLTYHSQSRSMLSHEDLLAADIVLTTYDTLASEFQEIAGSDDQSIKVPSAKKQKLVNSLWEITWWRIILDEAHVIRTVTTRRSKAVLSLKANLRWVVTGTLVVNSVADLEAPCQFLRLEPFCSDSALFKRYLVRPIKAGSTEAIAMVRALMKTISLRREKDTVQDFQLPIKNEVKVLIDLNAKEQDAYTAIHEAIKEYQAIVLATAGAAGILQHTHTMLSLITRLRQACLDLRLVPATELVNILSKLQSIQGNGKANVERLTAEEKTTLLNKLNELFIAAGVGPSVTEEAGSGTVEVEDCMVCYEPLEESTVVIFRACKHTLCQVCVDHIFRTVNLHSTSTPHLTKAPCPMCRSLISRQDCLSFAALQSSCVSNQIVESAKDDTAGIRPTPSSKTLAILRELEQIHRRGEKTVIFSSFTSYLDILSAALADAGYKHCRIDGNVPQKRRASEIERFTNDDSIMVMLCSLKACGVGITLTRANNIFLTDLWWAPSIDLQAIDRVHRIGQTRPVNVLRFLVRASIDEKIFELQLKKIALAKEVAKPLTSKELSDLRAKDIMALLN